MNIVEEKNEEKCYFLEGDIVKDLNHSNYYIAVKEEKGYILRDVCGAEGLTGYHLTIKDLEDSINFHLRKGIKVFSRDEYNLVLTRKKKEM